VIDPTVIEILAAAARAAGPLLERVVGALTEDHREAVLEALARDREALDAAPDVLARVEAAIVAARARVQAHEQARGNTIRDRYGVMDTTRLALHRLAADGPISHEDRAEARQALRLVDAALRGELAIAQPVTLAAPVGAWSEPAHEED
jgi:hypothetical protein